jgi:hypothetical protein
VLDATRIHPAHTISVAIASVATVIYVLMATPSLIRLARTRRVEDVSAASTELLVLSAVLVHKSAVGRGSAAIAVCQAMRCDTGMPSRVIRLSTEQATRASVFWLGRVRARRPRPMMVLYRNTAVSPSERLP